LKIKIWLKNSLLTGLIVVVPITITVYILKVLIDVADGILSVLPPPWHPDSWLKFHFPGLGLVLVTLFIFLVGLLTRNFFGARLVHYGDRLVARIPIVRTVYQSVKQLTEAVLGNSGQSFQKVVLVEFPRSGIYSVGFLAGSAAAELETQTGKKMWSVFIPCTPNPTTGYYVVVPESEVIFLDMTVEEAFKLIISGGLITPTKTPDSSLKRP